MEPTKLEMLDNYKKIDAGHIFSPNESNARIIISGRNWSKKSVLIYGSESTEEAEGYLQEILEDLNEIDRDVVLKQSPKITNIAVNGDLGLHLPLEFLSTGIENNNINIEYEPEQFPALVVGIKSPKSTFMLYSTGKSIIQGLTRKSDIDIAVDRIVEILNSFDNE